MAPSDRHYFIDDPADRAAIGDAMVAGAIVGEAYANFYAIVTRPDEPMVRRVNLMKGRPPEQVGSVTTTIAHIDHLFDWSQLPLDLGRERLRPLMDDLFDRGPIGLRGPAAAHLPKHLTSIEDGVRTVQLVPPGYRCPSNALFDYVLEQIPEDYLYVTSANHSHFVTGAVEEPAHFEAEGLAAEFIEEKDFVLIRHRDEAKVRAAYPELAPMSTTLVAFHRFPEDEHGRPQLIAERHGSFPLALLSEIAERHGFGLVVGPHAARRLPQRPLRSG